MNYKEEFYGFHRESLNKEKLTEENTIIVFDTNSLLNVFRFTPEASKKYFEIVQSIQDKIYIPYLVALEFHFHKSETLLSFIYDLDYDLFEDIDIINFKFYWM